MKERHIEAALSQSGLTAKRFSDVPAETTSRYQFLLYPSDNTIVEGAKVLVSPSVSRSAVVRAALGVFESLPVEEKRLLLVEAGKEESGRGQ